MTIETSDIYRALRQTLENNFENIKVQIKDVKNPKPPCFYVKFVDENTVKSAEEYTNDNIIFDVIYFSAASTLKDLFSKEKLLKKIFSKPLKIQIGDILQYQEIESVSINLNEEDYILNCTLEISLNQKDDNTNRYEEYDNDELMEEIEI